MIGRLRTAAGVAATVALLAACSGGGPTALTDPEDIPPRHRGAPADVDVCQLISASDASSAIARPLRVVGVQYGPSRVPTFRCLLGEEFGVAELTVELAIGPVSRNVFLAAYGEHAGGDPEQVKRLGGFGLLRSEKSERSLHVDVRGNILSLRLVDDPARPVPRQDLLNLARSAIDRLPDNPRLAGTAPGPRCARIPTRLIGAVVGIEPARAAGLDAPDGSVICSWASFPGSVEVTVIRDAARVRGYRATLDEGSYVYVRGLGAGVAAFSRSNRPGDLTIFAKGAMAFIAATPSAGYPDDSIITTPDEIVLSRAIVKSLM